MHRFRYKVLLIYFILIQIEPFPCKQLRSEDIMEQVGTDRDLERLVIKLVQFLSGKFKLNCAALISDEVYLDLFDGEWFHRAMTLSYIMTVVKQSEDLLSPNYATVESIKLVRRESCKLYIIFLSNGIQASRLLKFGDRHRIIDTRAKFIMMHDVRLFRPDAHYIWKRIIDVVFIRRRARNSSRSRFELSTVVYPPLSQKVLLPRQLTTWRSGQPLEIEPLFRDKTANLKEHVLKVVALEHVPAVQKGAQSFTGIEIEIIRAVSKAMNFKSMIYESPDAVREKWGQKQLNGSFNGLLGEMVAGKADIALGNLHYTPYHLQISDLTIPYISQCLTFLTPEAFTDNSWKTLILPFKLNMWVAVLIGLILSGLIFFGLAKFHRHNSKQKSNKEKGSKDEYGLYIFEEITNSILYTYGMLLVVSLPKLPSSWSIRLLTGWYWLYCVLVTVSYRASLTAILANPVPRVTIDTMKQLAESHIECGGWGEQNRDFFLTSLDDIGQKIGNKFKIINNPNQAVEQVAKGKLAYYENIYFLNYLSAKSKNSSTEITVMHTNESLDDPMPQHDPRNLHIMKDCAIHMPISIGLQKNSPLKPRADKLVRSIIEAGLIQKWLDDVMGTFEAKDSSDESVKAVMNLPKFYSGFIALGIGYFFSCLSLIVEIVHWNKVLKKDPNFDKYAIGQYYALKKGKQIF